MPAHLVHNVGEVLDLERLGQNAGRLALGAGSLVKRLHQFQQFDTWKYLFLVLFLVSFSLPMPVHLFCNVGEVPALERLG